jgi:hypothetical protein
MSMPTTAKSARAGSFCWEFPGSPLRINISLGVISRLRADLDQHEGLASGTTQVGGVLLGRRNTPGTLEIDDYVWVSSEGPQSEYSVNLEALERLRLVYTFVVGYFRTHSDDDLRLRDEEITFIRNHFGDPTDVVLLIQTSREPYTAGFFFWMTQDVLAPLSFMDFPLDPELLRREPESLPSEVRAAQPTRDAGMATRVPATTTVNPPAQKEYTNLKAAAPAQKQPANRDVVTPRRPANLHVAAPQRPANLNVAAQRKRGNTNAAAQEEPAKPPWLEELSTIRPSQLMLVIAGGVLLFALVFAGISTLLFQERRDPEFRQNASVTALEFPLQLDVEAGGNGVNVRWNPQSAAVVQAREGRLVIRESDKRQTVIQLGRQELMSGHLYYRSSAERLQFELEIVDTAGKVSKESVLALSPKSSQTGIPSAPQR